MGLEHITPRPRVTCSILTEPSRRPRIILNLWHGRRTVAIKLDNITREMTEFTPYKIDILYLLLCIYCLHSNYFSPRKVLRLF